MNKILTGVAIGFAGAAITLSILIINFKNKTFSDADMTVTVVKNETPTSEIKAVVPTTAKEAPPPPIPTPTAKVTPPTKPKTTIPKETTVPKKTEAPKETIPKETTVAKKETKSEKPAETPKKETKKEAPKDNLKITTGLRATGTNGCKIYYSKIDKSLYPKVHIQGGAFNAHKTASNLNAVCAIDAGMIYGEGNYFSYDKMWTNYYGHQCGETLCLHKDGTLDSIYFTPESPKDDIFWAVKGLNVYTRNGKRTDYSNVGYNPYSFIAQDYDNNYYIGAFSNANFTVMHDSLKKNNTKS